MVTPVVEFYIVEDTKLIYSWIAKLSLSGRLDWPNWSHVSGLITWPE